MPNLSLNDIIIEPGFFFIMDLLLKKKHRVSFFMFPAKYENVNL